LSTLRCDQQENRQILIICNDLQASANLSVYQRLPAVCKGLQMFASHFDLAQLQFAREFLSLLCLVRDERLGLPFCDRRNNLSLQPMKYAAFPGLLPGRPTV